MPESITITFAGREVGIQYHPESPEATFRDEMLARELALHALAAQAVVHRAERGIPVPPALAATVQAHTFHDLM
jgi:hypothetical protein